MQFSSWQAVVDMGGYGFYVWLSFGVTFLAIGLLLVNGLMQRRQIQREAVKQQKRAERIAKRQQQDRSN